MLFSSIKKIKMLKKINLLTTLLLLFVIINSFSQRETENWYFGNKAGLNFSASTPTVIQGSSIFSTKGSSSISDKNGNTVFYSNGTFLKNDKNFNIVTTYGGSNGELTQSAIFIPTNDENIYHYFTLSIESQSPGPGGPNFDPGFYHYMLDKRLNNGNGGIIPQRESHIINTGGMSEKMSAIHHSDGKSIWLAVLGNETNLNNSFDTFFIYKIDETGVSNPIIHKLEIPLDYSDGAIKFSPDGEKLVLTGYEKKVILFKFNKQNASIVKEKEFGTFVDLGVWAIPYGVEFSQDSKLLYLTGVDQNSLTYLFQLDIEETDINKIRTELYTDNSIIPGALQISSDGKIYMAIAEKSQINTQSSYLGVINSPTTIGIRSNYEHNAINLEQGKSVRSLPNFIQSYFRTRILTEKGCENSDILFEVDTYANITDAKWDFGDGTQSSEITPNKKYTSSGEYTVTATITINNRQITVNKNIIIFSPPITFNNQKIIQCDTNNDGIDNFNLTEINDKITNFNSTHEYSFFENNLDALNNNNKIQEPENYENLSNPQELFARILDLKGCFSIVSFTIESKFVQLASIPNMYSCESSDNINNNFEGEFNLRSKRIEIRNLLSVAPTTTLKFYPDFNSAQTKRNELEDTFSSITTKIWVRADTVLGCGGIQSINLIVNDTPNINIQKSYTLCIEPSLNTPIILDGGVSNEKYQWRNSNNQIISTSREYTLTNIGEFTLTVFKTQNNIECSNSETFTVINPPSAEFERIDIFTEDKNNVVININGNSTYEFSLDNINFFGQSNTYTFNDVSPGAYTLYVKDFNNCEPPIKKNIAVIGFQKFFTPNNDAINDTWKIRGATKEFFNFVDVTIFNRYGTLIYKINLKNDSGWDGRYNGKLLPSGNFWYKAKLIDKNEISIIESGSFSLIRN